MAAWILSSIRPGQRVLVTPSPLSDPMRYVLKDHGAAVVAADADPRLSHWQSVLTAVEGSLGRGSAGKLTSDHRDGVVHLPWPDDEEQSPDGGGFDVIVAQNVALTRLPVLRRALAPGGRLLLVLHTRGDKVARLLAATDDAGLAFAGPVRLARPTNALISPTDHHACLRAVLTVSPNTGATSPS